MIKQFNIAYLIETKEVASLLKNKGCFSGLFNLGGF